MVRPSLGPDIVFVGVSGVSVSFVFLFVEVALVPPKGFDDLGDVDLSVPSLLPLVPPDGDDVGTAGS